MDRTGRGGRPARDPALRYEDEVFSELSAWEQDVELEHRETALDPEQDRPWVNVDRRATLESPHFTSTRARRPAKQPQGKTNATVMGQLLLFLGIAGLTCGLTMLGLSVWDDRPALWSLGVPVIAIGQLALIMWVALEIGTPQPNGTARESRAAGGKSPGRVRQQHDVLQAPAFTRSRRAARRGI